MINNILFMYKLVRLNSSQLRIDYKINKANVINLLYNIIV